MMHTNHRISFIKRPGVNAAATCDCFGYEECNYPEDPGQDEVLLKSLYLSVDPALRCRMNEDTGVSYMGPWGIGETVTGASGIGLVVSSSHSSYKQGDIVQAQFGWPWIEYFTQKVDEQFQLHKLDPEVVGGRLSLYLSVLSLTSGLTSYLGIKEKGHIIPGANQTLVVSGAAGSCGSLAGQIGRLQGCSRVVGICGTDEKCKYLRDTLRFDGAINYKTQNVDTEMKMLCPSGVDVYFDNVGGEISDAVIKQAHYIFVPFLLYSPMAHRFILIFHQMNSGSHVILCGQISVYNKDLPYPPPIPDDIQLILQEKNITRERYLVLNYPEQFDSGLQKLSQWLLQGQLKVKETIEMGLENSGKAFVSMMNGGNTGKQIVQVSSLDS